MKLMSLIATGLIAMLFSGCATVKQTYSSDGRKAYALNCSGTARGWDKCFSAAGELCGTSGYDVLDRNSEDTVHAGGGGNANGVAYGATKTNERTMLISCKTK